MRHYSRKRQNPMKRFTIFVLITIGLCALAVFLWWNRGTAAVNPTDTMPRTFIIKQGTLAKEIAEDLENQGLVTDATVFSLLIKQLGISDKIQAGSFQLSPAMDAYTIAKTLTQASVDLSITIPEGKRAEEIADILEGVMPQYTTDWRNELITHEGYLFPDTYRFSREATVAEIIATLTDHFEKKYAEVISTTDLTKEEIVILASMIERETRHDEDRPLVSSVLHNRLELAMALQVDATIQYAKGKIGDSWWKPVTQADYQSIHSDYNTYLSPGLPPGPISNPGLKSLQAAAKPADTDYLFYITDQTGTNRYARTLTEHNNNIKKYGLSSK